MMTRLMVLLLLVPGCSYLEKRQSTPEPKHPPLPQIPSNGTSPAEPSRIQALSLEFFSDSQKIVVAGEANVFHEDVGVRERRPFYFTGNLAHGTSLTEPISSGNTLTVRCATATCHRFSLELGSEWTQGEVPISVERWRVAEVVPAEDLVEPGFLPPRDSNSGRANTPGLEALWRRLLLSPPQLENSSFLVAKIGEKTFWTLTLVSPRPSVLSHEFVTISPNPRCDSTLEMRALFGGDGTAETTTSGYESGHATFAEGWVNIQVGERKARVRVEPFPEN